MYLPEKFERKMQDILGDEYQEYVDCYEAPRYSWAACEYEEDISGGLCPDLSI